MDRMDWPEAICCRWSKTKDPTKDVFVGAVRSPRGAGRC